MKPIVTAPSLIEDGLIAQGFSPIAGVDEVGRGPMAGPVVACAVILPDGQLIPGVNDSKKLTEKRRTALAEEIKNAAISYAFGIIQPHEIDEINILQATLKAMVLAVGALKVQPSAILVDGTIAPKFSENPHQKIICIPKGDSSSHLIAAASILAKVKRDNIMMELHERFAAYNWAKNKGYGTAAHMEAIEKFGLSPLHRKSFCKKWIT